MREYDKPTVLSEKNFSQCHELRVMAFAYLNFATTATLQRGRKKHLKPRKARVVKRRPTAAVSIELTSVRAVTSAKVDTATLCPLDVNSNVNISRSYATTRTRSTGISRRDNAADFTICKSLIAVLALRF